MKRLRMDALRRPGDGPRLLVQQHYRNIDLGRTGARQSYHGGANDEVDHGVCICNSLFVPTRVCGRRRAPEAIPAAA